MHTDDCNKVSNVRVYLLSEAFIALQVLDFPGGKVRFSPELSFISESHEERAHCYRVLDDDGLIITGSNYVQVYLP